jgi:hypothetical protein
VGIPLCGARAAPCAALVCPGLQPDALVGDALVGDALAGDARVGDTLVGDALVGDALIGEALGDMLGDAPGSALGGALDAASAALGRASGATIDDTALLGVVALLAAASAASVLRRSGGRALCSPAARLPTAAQGLLVPLLLGWLPGACAGPAGPNEPHPLESHRVRTAAGHLLGVAGGLAAAVAALAWSYGPRARRDLMDTLVRLGLLDSGIDLPDSGLELLDPNQVSSRHGSPAPAAAARDEEGGCSEAATDELEAYERAAFGTPPAVGTAAADRDPEGVLPGPGQTPPHHPPSLADAVAALVKQHGAEAIRALLPSAVGDASGACSSRTPSSRVAPWPRQEGGCGASPAVTGPPDGQGAARFRERLVISPSSLPSLQTSTPPPPPLSVSPQPPSPHASPPLPSQPLRAAAPPMLPTPAVLASPPGAPLPPGLGHGGLAPWPPVNGRLAVAVAASLTAASGRVRLRFLPTALTAAPDARVSHRRALVAVLRGMSPPLPAAEPQPAQRPAGRKPRSPRSAAYAAGRQRERAAAQVLALTPRPVVLALAWAAKLRRRARHRASVLLRCKLLVHPLAARFLAELRRRAASRRQVLKLTAGAPRAMEYDVGHDATSGMFSFRSLCGLVSCAHPATGSSDAGIPAFSLEGDIVPPQWPPRESSIVLAPEVNGAWCYVDTASGATTWSAPAGSTSQLPTRVLKPGMFSQMPPRHDGRLDFNRLDGTPWVPIWEDASDEIGLYNRETGAVRNAPWVSLRTASGCVYFANLTTRDTRWFPPHRWMEDWQTRPGFALNGYPPHVGASPTWGSPFAECPAFARALLPMEIARLRVDGGAPYSDACGLPQYEADKLDTALTYPGLQPGDITRRDAEYDAERRAVQLLHHTEQSRYLSSSAAERKEMLKRLRHSDGTFILPHLWMED